MILLTGLYVSGNKARDAELRLCLTKNFANQKFDAFWTFQEQPFDDIVAKQFADMWRSPKNRVQYGAVGIGRRCTYKDYFEWANRELPAGSLVCLANSDIYFDETISLVKSAHLDNVFMCLSRWRENTPDEAARDGHDAWIFKAPVKIPPGSDFVLGCIAQDRILGVSCNDTCIAGLMEEVGYKIVNPGLDVKAYHVHESNFRNYAMDDRLLFKPKRRVLRSHLEAV